MRPNTAPNGSVAALLLDVHAGVAAGFVEDVRQHPVGEHAERAACRPEFLSESSLTALRMKGAFAWLSMLSLASPVLPPWPQYDEFHSVLNDMTWEVV